MTNKATVRVTDHNALVDQTITVEGSRLLDLDMNIFRIFRPQHIVEMFETRENVLVSPTKWDDPYETLLLQADMELPKGEIAKWEKRDIYAQCWMKTRDSDAMWRIYSYDSFAIRARTTVRKLIQSVINARSPDWVHLEAFIGAVAYKGTEAFERWAMSFFATAAGPRSRSLAETLMVKRWAFQHEKEVRVILLPAHDKTTGRELHRYPIDPHWLIDNLMVDSRAPKEIFELYKNYFVEKLKFRGAFTRSKLYDRPTLMRIPFGYSGATKR